jgi:hypothetical protein
MYGAACRRDDEDHRRRFRHPPVEPASLPVMSMVRSRRVEAERRVFVACSCVR